MDYEKPMMIAPPEQKIKKLENENRMLRFKLEAYENHLISSTDLSKDDICRLFESEIANDCLCWKSQAETRQELLNENDKEISEKDAMIIQMTDEINQLKSAEKQKEKQYETAAVQQIRDIIGKAQEAKGLAISHLAAALNELAKIQ